MPQTNLCAECGALLPAFWPKGLCAQCALDGALEMTHAQSQVPQPGPLAAPSSLQPPLSSGENPPLASFGDYELLEEIARGGMGVVYKARQKNLGRVVAVKMILAGPLAGKEFVRRFRTESAAAAILQHPNIVAVHDVGVHEGRHFFSMDYVNGPNLVRLVGQQPLLAPRAARYVQLIAEAIHCAHEHGILHRDLKPSNVLVDANDQPRVTDFGLAKRLDAESSLTLTGHVLGSPNFMPPEQAGAKRGKVGRPSDVYALGGILYHLLTARAPFQAESLEQLIVQVLNAEPVSPRLLNPSVPRDLETITLKCLQKEPANRYQTAQELAEELSHFLRHEPIQARPLTAHEKLWRWCKRRPALASVLGLAAATFLVGFGTTSWQWRRAEKNALSERHQRQRAETGESNLVHQLYTAKMNLTQSAWEQNNVSRMRELLRETATASERGFEWYYWQRQTHTALRTLRGHRASILAVAFSRDGQRIVTGSADSTAKVWDAATGQELRTLQGHTNAIWSVGFSADGQRIVTGSRDGSAKVWDAASGKELVTLKGHESAILSATFSLDGQRIVTGSEDHTAKLWEASSGRELLTFTGHVAVVFSVAFSSDGQRIVSGSWDQTARVWEPIDGKEMLILHHRAPIFSVAFSPDGRRIVAGSEDQTAPVWSAADGHPLLPLVGHTASIFSVAFSPDGGRIATGADDQTAKLWNAVTGELLLTLKGHGSPISSVAFSPDGRRLVTGGGSVGISPGGQVNNPGIGDHLAKLWDASGAREFRTLAGHSSNVLSVAFSPDGQRLVSGHLDNTAKVWEVATGKMLTVLNGHTNAVRSVAYSPDGGRIVTGSWDGTAKVWEAATGTELVPLRGHESLIMSVAFSPDGQQILTGSQDNTARVWDAASGQNLLTLHGGNQWFWAVAFSPDGRKIVAGNADLKNTAKVWDAADGRELATLRGHADYIMSVAFSPDGRRIVTGSHDQTARVWDAVSGQEVLPPLTGHRSWVMSVAFSPDGRRILTGSEDHTAKLWDAGSGQELLTLNGHGGWVFSVAFSRDGKRIATGSGDQTIRLWEAASLEEVATWQQEEQLSRGILQESLGLDSR